MLQLVMFNLTNGLIVGAFYVLMALGLSLIINLSNVVNFAHGNFLAIGGYIAFTLTPYVGFWGALLISPFLTAIMGYAIEKLLIRHVYARNHIYSLLLTFGLGFILQDACRYLWGPSPLPLGIPDMLSQAITPDLFFVTWYRVFMVVVVIVAVGRPVRLPALHAGRHAHPRRHARPRYRVGAGRQRGGAAVLQLRGRQLPRRPRRRAGGGPDRPQPQHGRRPDHAELHRHHRGRCRQPDRHACWAAC